MTKIKKVNFEDLLNKLDYMTDEEINLVKKCYEFISKLYFGKKRLTGDNYIDHPLSVSYIIAKMNADVATVCSGLLCNIYEFDENIDIESLFGKEIATLISGVQKLKKLNFDLSTESSTLMQRKILVGLTDDVRVIIITLAERLDDMRNLWVLSFEEQKRISEETIHVLTPIAERLGMNKFKSELEDLALRYSKPDIYFDIVDKLNQTKQQRDNSVRKMIDEVSKILDENGIKHQIKGRSKSIYSIYKKLDKGRKFSEIFDLLALRVFVETEAECYQVLGLIHSKYKPKPRRFKDYIAMPKTNMYQSLHTTVFGVDDFLFEIQIRTYEMDEVAERGIAAHYAYKEHGSIIAQKNEMEEKLQFFKTLIDLDNEDTTDEEYVSSVKEEFNNMIYVFTPRGDVIELPSGSTPIDFAYKVHSGVGEKMVGAVVNDSLVPLDYELENEDVVKINTSNNSNGPSLEWINMAKTNQAKNKIKSFFKKINKEEYLKKGEDLLNKELHKRKISYNEFYTDENKEKIIKNFKADLNEIYILIGNGKLSPVSVINAIFEENDTKEDILLKKVLSSNKVQAIKKDIIVEGIDDIKIKLSSCCHPIPGDNIVGYITKGAGISVHSTNCPNLADLNERLIPVSWGDVEGKKYPTALLIKTIKKNNILLEIVSKAANINIESINTYNNYDDIVFKIVILVKDVDSLNKFISSVKSIPECISVERSFL